jgi:hypothetical protein
VLKNIKHLMRGIFKVNFGYSFLLFERVVLMEIAEQLVQLWKKEYPEQSSDFPRFFEWQEQMISISSIGFSQLCNMDKANQYLDLMKQGAEFPPLVVLHIGGDHFELIDGFHRIWAKNQLCDTFVKVLVGRNRYERCS